MAANWARCLDDVAARLPHRPWRKLAMPWGVLASGWCAHAHSSQFAVELVLRGLPGKSDGAKPLAARAVHQAYFSADSAAAADIDEAAG